MLFKKTKQNKLLKFKQEAYGIENQCIKFLTKKGYNSRYPIEFIRKENIVKAENLIFSKIIPKEEKDKPEAMIFNLKKIQCRRGKRHVKCLPTRGQRTKTNAKSAKRFRVKKNESKNFKGKKKK